MASPTGSDTHKPASMAPTPGVSPGAVPQVPAASLSYVPEQGNRLGGMPKPSQDPHGSQGADIPPAPPFLFSDLEPVHFTRLYPGAKDGAAEAMKAGKAAFDAAKHVVAAQQDPGDAEPADAPKH